MVGGDHCLFFWMEQRPSGVHIEIKNNVKLIECRIVHFASLKSSTCFEKIKKLDLDYSYRQILSLVWPPEIPRDIASISSILRRAQKWRVS